MHGLAHNVRFRLHFLLNPDQASGAILKCLLAAWKLERPHHLQVYIVTFLLEKCHGIQQYLGSFPWPKQRDCAGGPLTSQHFALGFRLPARRGVDTIHVVVCRG